MNMKPVNKKLKRMLAVMLAILLALPNTAVGRLIGAGTVEAYADDAVLSIRGEAKFGAELSASITGDGAENYNNPTYSWKRGNNEVGTSSTYTIVEEDIGNTISLSVTQDTVTELTAETGTITKADGPAAPDGLGYTVVSAAAKATITGLAGGTSYQYKASTAEESEYADINGSTELDPGTYNVRVKETKTQFAGSAAEVTIPDIYTVSFDLNGHGDAIASQYIAAGGKATAPAAPTATGYVFKGWFKEEELTNAFDFDNDTIDSDTTIYAKWVEEITVTFNSDGGTDVEAQKIGKGDKATRPQSDPTKSDFKFVNWYSDEGLTTAFDFDTALEDNTTIYAKWRDNVAPAISSAAVAPEDGDYKLTITLSAAETDGGKYYYLISEKADSYSESADYVKEAGISGNLSTEAAATVVSLNVSNLTPGTEYVCQVVAEDAAENLSAKAVTDAFKLPVIFGADDFETTVTGTLTYTGNAQNPTVSLEANAGSEAYDTLSSLLTSWKSNSKISLQYKQKTAGNGTAVENAEKAATVTAAGTYDIYAVLDNSIADYSISDASLGTLTVRRATSGATVTEVSNLTYDGEAKALVTENKNSEDVTILYHVDDEDADAEWSETAPQRTNAGTYEVSYRIANDPNYNNKNGSVTVVIEKAAPTLTVTQTALTPTYSSDLVDLVTASNISTTPVDLPLTYSISAGGDLVELETNDEGAQTGKVILKGAGTARIKVEVKASDNYKAASRVITLTIGKATPTVNLGVVVNGSYGSSTTAALTATVTGVGNDVPAGTIAFTYEDSGDQPINTDPVTLSAGEAEYTWDVPAALITAGSASIKATFTPATDSNYDTVGSSEVTADFGAPALDTPTFTRTANTYTLSTALSTADSDEVIFYYLRTLETEAAPTAAEIIEAAEEGVAGAGSGTIAASSTDAVAVDVSGLDYEEGKAYVFYVTAADANGNLSEVKTTSSVTAPKILTSDDVRIGITALTYNGSEQTPVPSMSVVDPDDTALATWLNLATITYGYKQIRDGLGNDLETEATVSDKVKDAGTYEVYASVNDNTYSITEAPIRTFVVNRKASAMTVAGATGLEYTGAAQALVTESNKEADLTGVYYKLDGELWTETGVPAAADVESYTVSWGITGDPNYTDKAEEAIEDIAISKLTATLTVGTNTFTGTYGTDNNVNLATQCSITKTGDGTITYKVTSGNDIISVDEAGVMTVNGAGTATVNVSLPETGNCGAGTPVDITVTINKATAALTLTPAVDGANGTVELNAEVTTAEGDAAATGTVAYSWSTNNSDWNEIVTGQTLREVYEWAKANWSTADGQDTVYVKAVYSGDDNYDTATKSATIDLKAPALTDNTPAITRANSSYSFALTHTTEAVTAKYYYLVTEKSTEGYQSTTAANVKENSTGSGNLTAGTSTSITIDGSSLTGGTTYVFQVVAEDANGFLSNKIVTGETLAPTVYGSSDLSVALKAGETLTYSGSAQDPKNSLEISAVAGGGNVDAVTTWLATTPTITYSYLQLTDGDGETVSNATAAADVTAAGTYGVYASVTDDNIAIANDSLGTIAVGKGTATVPNGAPTLGAPVVSSDKSAYEVTADTSAVNNASGQTFEYSFNGGTTWVSNATYSAGANEDVNVSIRFAATVNSNASEAVAAAASVTTGDASAAPVIDPAGTTFTDSQEVTITAENGATIYYTTDGSTPTASSDEYSDALTINATTTVKAVALESGKILSEVASATYTKSSPSPGPGPSPTPTVAVTGVTVAPKTATISLSENKAVQLTATVAPEDASDKSVTWSQSSSDGGEVLFSGTAVNPVSVTAVKAGTVTVTATTTDGSKTDTATITITDDVIKEKAATPEFSPAAGTYTLSQNVIITSATEGAVIHYTTDGSTPSSESPSYSNPILVDKTMTIKAIAVKEGMDDSDVATAAYVLDSQAVPVTSVTVNPAAVQVLKGETYKLSAVVMPEDATDKTVTWTSLDTSKVTVTDGGVITGVAAGTATIRAEAGGVSGTATVTVSEDAAKEKVIAETDEETKVEIAEDLNGGKLSDLIGNDPADSNTVVVVDTQGNVTETKVWVGGIDSEYRYTGAAIKPEPHVYDGTTRLIKGTDYTVSYQKNKTAGTATVTVKFKGNYKNDPQKISFAITPAIIGEDVIVTAAAQEAGRVVKPKLTYVMKATGASVAAGKFTVAPSGKITIAEGESRDVTVSAKDTKNFTGSETVSIEAAAKAKLINNAKITINPKSYTYTGEEIIPADAAYTVKEGSTVLTPGTDYEISGIFNNIEPGKATVVIEGAGDYKGSKAANFTIKKGMDLSVDEAEIYVDGEKDATVVYAKGGVSPVVTVYADGRKLVKGTDYTVKYSGNKAATTGATAVAKVTFKGKYKGTKEAKFAIAKQELENLSIVAEDKVKSNKAKFYEKPVLTITDLNGKKLAKSDYTLGTDYVYDEESGIVTVSLAGKGSYADTPSTLSYRVIDKAQNIKSAKAAKIADQTYTGSEITLADSDLTGKLTLSGKTLVPGTDFDIDEGSYRNNMKKGTASFVVRGTGDCGGVKTLKFKIVQKKINWNGSYVNGKFVK